MPTRAQRAGWRQHSPVCVCVALGALLAFASLRNGDLGGHSDMARRHSPPSQALTLPSARPRLTPPHAAVQRGVSRRMAVRELRGMRVREEPSVHSLAVADFAVRALALANARRAKCRPQRVALDRAFMRVQQAWRDARSDQLVALSVSFSSASAGSSMPAAVRCGVVRGRAMPMTMAKARTSDQCRFRHRFGTDFRPIFSCHY